MSARRGAIKGAESYHLRREKGRLSRLVRLNFLFTTMDVVESNPAQRSPTGKCPVLQLGNIEDGDSAWDVDVQQFIRGMADGLFNKGYGGGGI